MRRIGVCAYTTSSLAKLALAAKLWRAVFTVRPPTLLETRFTEQLFKIGQQKRNKHGCGCRWVAVAVARGSWLWLWLGLLARLLARLLFGVYSVVAGMLVS